MILALLFASPLLSLATPVPDLAPNRAADPPTRVGVYPRQNSVRLGRRMPKKPEPLQKKDYSSFLCPASAVACPVVEPDTPVTTESISKLTEGLNSLADWFTVGFECVELASELNQCGGCLALGEGQDCSKIPNARATGCDNSSCAVYSCFEGFTVSPDKKSCVKRGSTVTNTSTNINSANSANSDSSSSNTMAPPTPPATPLATDQVVMQQQQHDRSSSL